MGFWDFIKTAIIVEGVDHILHSKDNKKPHNGYDPGAWRRDLDRENDSYRHLYSDENDF